MKVKIVINTSDAEGHGIRRSEIWNGEMEILDKKEYLVMISVIGEGQPQPICQIPFAMGIGHYLWVPPDKEIDGLMEGDYEW